MLRIRQAYVRLTWPRSKRYVWPDVESDGHTSCLRCRDWPLGSPFSPFNRSPQLNVALDLGHGWNGTAAALYQFPNASTGPDGITYNYSRWSAYPEVYLGIKHVGPQFTAGIGADVLSSCRAAAAPCSAR